MPKEPMFYIWQSFTSDYILVSLVTQTLLIIFKKLSSLQAMGLGNDKMGVNDLSSELK